MDVTIPPELRGEEAPQRFRGAGPVPGNLGVAAESVQPAASSVKQAVQEGVKSAADVLSGKSHNPESYHEGYDSGMKAHREHVPGAQGDDQRLYFDPAGADTREIVTGHSECPNVSESAQESARDTAKNVRESFVGDAPDRLRGGAEPPGDSSQGWMAKAQEAVSFGMHKVQDTLTATKDTVSEYAQSATNTAKDTAVKGNENIYSVAGMGKENVQSAAQSGKENIKAAAQQGKESYASAADTGSAAFQSATGTVKENVQYATEMGKENIESASAKTKGAAAKGNEALQSAGAMGRENIQSAASKGKDGLQATKDRAQQLGQDAQKQKDTTLGESPERLRGGAEPPGDTHSWTAKAHETLSSGIQKMQDTLTLSKKSGQAESAAAKGKENVQSSADKGKGSFLSSKDRSQSLKEEMRGQAPEVTQRSKEDLNLSGPAMTPSGHQLKEKSQDLQEAVKADMGANLTSGSESATKGNRVVEETVPHRLRGAGEPGKEGVGNLLSSAKEKISSGSEKVKQSTQGAQDTKGKAEEAYQKGQETVSQTRDQQQSASGGPQRMRGGSPTSSGHGESWTGALKSKISHGVEAVTGAFTGPSPGSQSNAPADIKAIPTAELRMPEENSGTLSEDMSTKAHHWASDAKDAIAEEANKSRKILIAAEKRRKTDTVDPSLMEYHENVLSGVPGVDDEPYMPSEVRETIGLGLDEGIEAYPGPMRLSEEQKLHPEHDWTKATRDSLSHAMEKVRETFKLHPDERKSKGASVDIGKHASTVDFYSGKGDSPSERATPQRLRGAATGAQMMEDRGTQWQERGKAEGKGLAGKARESMSGSKSKRGQDVTKDVGDRPGREQSAQGRGSKEGGESGLRGHQRTGQQERDGSGQERGMLEGKQEMTQQRRSVQGKEQRGMSERISGGRGEEGRTEKGRDTAESYELSDEERRILVERFQEIVTGIKKDPEYLKVFRFMIDSLRQVESEIRKRAIAKAEYPDRIENEWAGDANLVRAQLELRVSERCYEM